MKIKTLMLLIVICLFTFPLEAVAGEIYTWVDKNGVKHISTQRPESGKIIEKESFTPDSPEEIRRYQQQQKNLEMFREEQSKYNRREAERQRDYDQYVKDHKEREQRAQIKKQKVVDSRVKDLETEKARLRAIENRDYDEARRLRLKREREKIDDKIKGYSE